MKTRHRIRRKTARRAPAVRRACACQARSEAKSRMAGDGELMIGGARDPAEKAADTVAERVLAAPGPVPVAHRMCAECADEAGAVRRRQEFEPPEEEPEVRRSAPAARTAPGAAAAPASAPAAAAIRSLGPGAALTRSERAFFEPRLGADLSHVRVHAGDRADRASRLISAEAFTIGDDIAFAAGRRDQQTAAGRRLMAHELAHALQSGRQPARAHTVSRQPARCETCPNPVAPEVAVAVTPNVAFEVIAGGGIAETRWDTANVSRVSLLQRERNTCAKCDVGGQQHDTWDVCPRRIVVQADVDMAINRDEIGRVGAGGRRWHMDCADNTRGARFVTPAHARANFGDARRYTVAGGRLHEGYHVQVSQRLLRERLQARNDITQVCPYSRTDIDAWKAALIATLEADALAFLQGNPSEPNEETNANAAGCPGHQAY